MDRSSFAAAHLDLRLATLNRTCQAAVATQQREAAELDRPELAARAITDRHVAVLLERVDRLVSAAGRRPAEPAVLAADLAAETQLRARAQAAGVELPLDAISACYGLTELDRQALVGVLAPEIDRAYERIYAYLCDEWDRRHPSVELLVLLTHGLAGRYAQRLALGPYGTLRRQRLVVAHGDAPSDLRQQLRLAPGILEFMLGAAVDMHSLGGEPAAGEPAAAPQEVVCEPYPVGELAAALQAGTADMVAVWGPREAAAAAATAVAAALGLALRQVSAVAAMDPDRVGGAFREAAIAAGLAGGLIWLPLELPDEPPPGLFDAVAAVLETTGAPVVVSAATPWRPAGVLARRRVVEVRVNLAGVAQRARAWRSRQPQLSDADAIDLAARFRLSPTAAAAAARLAAVGAALNGGGPAPVAALEAACAALSTPRPDSLVSVVEPRRGPDDLILSAALHRQVVELATFARSLPTLDGADRPGGSQRGLKVLFTGEPGTGKTLAAEVIAGLLGVRLVTVDLSRVVSKWVGETAKHLDAVFRLADGSSAVLFFDEADALFGKRGEVQHGSDRYANTEVSHLLQRFEAHDGLVILASNLRDQIDPAFTRRFHTVVHFPRPEEPERRRLWRLALAHREGLPDGIDLAALAALDLTGAGIVGSARTATLLAAAAGAAGPSMDQLADGVARQFRTEGRLAPPADLAALAGASGGRSGSGSAAGAPGS
jgi:ATPase family associated with various cellular activities (AAA)